MILKGFILRNHKPYKFNSHTFMMKMLWEREFLLNVVNTLTKVPFKGVPRTDYARLFHLNNRVGNFSKNHSVHKILSRVRLFI